MTQFILSHLYDPEFWKLLSIPVIASLVGWSTNWLAIELTFYPLEFTGPCKWLGWQGVVPRFRHKMAGILVNNTLQRISTVRELYQEMDPPLIRQHIYRYMDLHLEDYIESLMESQHPVAWGNLPALARRQVLKDAHKQLPQTIDALMDEVELRIDELIDIREMATDQLCSDKTLLIRFFKRCGEKEFQFIIRSGAYLGFLFGIVQMICWQSFQFLWILPVFGIIVGLATNWIALKIIFQPLNPIKLGPVSLQGLFLKRQSEVSECFCQLAAHEVLTPRHFVRAMFYGKSADKTRALAQKHLYPALDHRLLTRTLAQVTLGFRGYSMLKRSVVDKALDISLDPFQSEDFNQQRAHTVQKMMSSRMKQMTPSEFQEVLRPVFSEEEWILVAMGGALGACAGFAQLLLIFGA